METKNKKTHRLIWIKVPTANAQRLDELAKNWDLTRASLCRLVVTQFLNEKNPTININSTNTHNDQSN
jgi:predicted DNA-binding protein